MGSKETIGEAAAIILPTCCRCDKVTTCKHQSKLELADRLSRAIRSSSPSPFGAAEHASSTGAAQDRTCVLSLSRYDND